MGPKYNLEIFEEMLFICPILFPDRKNNVLTKGSRKGGSICEFLHPLMAIIDDVNHCEVNQTWCSDLTLHDQFAEKGHNLAQKRIV